MKIGSVHLRSDPDENVCDMFVGWVYHMAKETG